MTAPVIHRHHLRHIDTYEQVREVVKALRKGHATVIRVGRPITFSSSPSDAQEMLAEKHDLPDAPQTLIVWPGKKATHVFEVDPMMAGLIADELA